MASKIALLCFVLIAAAAYVKCQETTEMPDTTESPPETTAEPETTVEPDTTISPATPEPKIECSKHGSTCSSCLEASDQCYYCGSTKECRPLPTNMPFGLPLDDSCSLDSAMYKTCDVSLLLLAICITSVGGALLLAGIMICICCCIRCHRRPKVTMDNIEVTWSNQQDADEKQASRDSRNEARESRYDEIRMKYGIKTTGYSKLDNDA